MPPSKYRSATPVGRDFDTKWVQWLARRKNPIAASLSPSSSTSSQTMPSSSIFHDSNPLHSRSTATSYFVLLSAAQDQQQHPRRQGRSPTPSPSMDSSWVTWFFDRAPRGSLRPTSEGASPQMQRTRVEPPSTSTAPAFAVSSLHSLHSPLLTALMDAEPLPGVPDDTLGDLEDMDLTGQDTELLTWLNQEDSFASEMPVGSCKRGLEEYPGELSVSKKQMVHHHLDSSKLDSARNSPPSAAIHLN